MLLKSVAFISVLAVFAQSVPATVKVLPFVDYSLPVKFREVIVEAAPKLPSNLASYQYGLDFAGSVYSNNLQCAKQSGYSAVFVRVYDPAGQGSFDQNSCYTIQNAYRAVLATEAYMTPQPYSNKQGYQQLDEIYQGLNGCGIRIRAIWVQVTAPSYWPSYQTNNIHFINSIVSRARQYGITVGVYTNNYDWDQITNGWNSIGSDVLLWYYNVLGRGVNGETQANFDDFRPFGGWTAATVKQFAQLEQICQINVNRDAYIVGAMLKSSDAVDKDGKIYAGGFIHGN